MVSNLLGSPASGEKAFRRNNHVSFRVSNLLGSPASGEADGDVNDPMTNIMFPIYWVPQRVGSRTDLNRRCFEHRVSNLLGSPASGE